MEIALVWIRRNLRLTDNRALDEALSRGYTVIPFFVINDALIEKEGFGDASCAFFFSSLQAFAHNLAYVGSKLIVRKGDFVTEIGRLVQETGAKAIFYNRDYEPNTKERDSIIEKNASAWRINVLSFKDHVLFEEDEILNAQGEPYKVFTPYSNVWRGNILQIPLPQKRPQQLSLPSIASNLESYPIPTFAHSQKPLVKAGEKEAQKQLKTFLETAIYAYATQRDIPSVKGTSLLSAQLRVGTLSIRQVFHQAYQLLRTANELQQKSIQTFINELIWRDFYQQVLFHYPQVETKNFKQNYDFVLWREAPDEFEKWCKGKTGYPLVDAAMHQLNTHGWMHNRLRMVTASFLTKHLLIHWSKGERYFAKMLIDYDKAANNGGWQWSASTGTDAQPYFRVFNPMNQSKKFDATGAFIKQYCPSLRNVPTKYIHTPWEMPESIQQSIGCIIGKDYPTPIVEHSFARKRVLEAFKK